MNSPATEHPKVFISYSHDSATQLGRVRRLSDRLRAGGVDAYIDQYEESPAEGWARWTARRVHEAQFVLIVCTENYAARFTGQAPAGTGLGAKWEGAVITQELYNAESHNTKFIPVLFSGADLPHVPAILSGVTNYRLDAEDGYEKLYRRLTNQPLIMKPELGAIQPMPRLAPVQDFGVKTDAPAPRPKGVWFYFLMALLVVGLLGGGFVTYEACVTVEPTPTPAPAHTPGTPAPVPATGLSSDGRLDMEYLPEEKKLRLKFALTLDNSGGTDADLLSNPNAYFGDAAAVPPSPLHSVNFAANDFNLTESGRAVERMIFIDKGEAKVINCILEQALRGRSGAIFAGTTNARLIVSFTRKDGKAISHHFCFENGKSSESFLNANCP
jgi:hypothetical protein